MYLNSQVQINSFAFGSLSREYTGEDEKKKEVRRKCPCKAFLSTEAFTHFRLTFWAQTFQGCRFKSATYKRTRVILASVTCRTHTLSWCLVARKWQGAVRISLFWESRD